MGEVTYTIRDDGVLVATAGFFKPSILSPEDQRAIAENILAPFGGIGETIDEFIPDAWALLPQAEAERIAAKPILPSALLRANGTPRTQIIEV